MRFFNTAGPIKPEMNYHIPPLDRINLHEVLQLIAQERYFVMHAPRQTGKTSALLALMDKLLTEFQTFFREHSEHWVERFQYKEAGPQLLLQAFLQRIVNSGGRIEREYGLGRMRTDLLILWPAPSDAQPNQSVQRIVIECKLLYKSLEQTVREGIEQTRAYMDRCDAEEGHLVVFDRTTGKAWEDKIFRREEGTGDAKVTVWGM